MEETIITCPECGAEIEVAEALLAPYLDKEKKKFEGEMQKKAKDLAAKEKLLKKQVSDYEKTLNELTAAYEKRLADEKKLVRAETEKKTKALLSEQVTELQNQLQEKDESLRAAKNAELKIRKEKRALEEARADLELTVEKRLAEERRQIAAKARETALQSQALTLADKDKKIADLIGQIDELKRRAEQGSQQAQGETQELVLKDMLKAAFPPDEIESVPKGVKGADCLQRVRAATGSFGGTIIWDSKRTKDWNDGWLSKIKDDQRACRADIPVLASQALPEGVTTFALIDGVWVTSFAFVKELAAALRVVILEAYSARTASTNQKTKMEALYCYLTGPEFRRRIEGIIEPFKTMREDLDAEKRAMFKQWAKREKQIERVVESVSCMHGDLQGLAGNEIAGLPLLELKGEREAPANCSIESGNQPKAVLALAETNGAGSH